MQSEEWHYGRTDVRGQVFGKFVTQLNYVLINEGYQPNLFHQRYGAVINVTFASNSTANWVKNWRVYDRESGSDHPYIHFEV